MQSKELENLKLLQTHLHAASLASRLVAAYIDTTTPAKLPAALDAVLEARLREVKNAIEHATPQLG